MLATQHSAHESYSPQQQYADNLAIGEDRICPGCKLSAVSEEGGLVVAFGCNVCKLPILDEAIMTGDDSYHAHCFKCKVCKNRIDELVFAKTSQGIYCMNCHNERMIRIRKHTQKKAEREKEKERERNALNRTASTTSSRDKEVRHREHRSSTEPQPTDSSVASTPSQMSRMGSLSDRAKPPSANQHNGQYIPDAFQNGQTSRTHPASASLSVTVAPPQDIHEAPIDPAHPTVFQPPPRTSSVDQERSTPLKKNTAPVNSYSSLEDLQPRRVGSVDSDFIPAPPTNGSGGLSVTSKAEKRRSINPGLVLNNLKAQFDSSAAPSSLSPSSASFAGKQHTPFQTPTTQNGHDHSRAQSPYRDRFYSEGHVRPDSRSSTSSLPHNTDGSRMRSVSPSVPGPDDQTIVLRPPLRTYSSESRSAHRTSLTPTQSQTSNEDSRPGSRQRLSITSTSSRSASRSRPSSRVDVPQGIESSTESENENETRDRELRNSVPPVPPPKEGSSRAISDDSSSDVHPLADLLSLKSDEQELELDQEQESSALSQPDSDETSESSPVEQTSHATFIAPALPPIRFSLNAADFSDLFTSVSGLPPLQQLAHLSSVSEQKLERDDRTPMTPPPSARTTQSTGEKGLEDSTSLLERMAHMNNSGLGPGRGRASSDGQAGPLKKSNSSSSQVSLSTTLGSDATQITVSPPGDANDKADKQDTGDLVLVRLQEVLSDAKERGAQQLKFDRSFVEAIHKAMLSRKADYSELKGNLDGIKRASKQYMDGLTVAQTEYDRELKQRRELEAEVTRLRVLLSGQAARLTALSGDSRRQELRQQMTKELNKNLSGLEQDLSKLKAERDMTLAEMEELSASKSTPSPSEPANNLSRSLTKRLDNLKGQYQRELVPLNQQREALTREIAELKAARDIFLEETTVLNARNEELAQLSAQYARRMAAAPPEAPSKSQESRSQEQKPIEESSKEKTRPPPITIQHSSHTKFTQPIAPPHPQPSISQPLQVQQPVQQPIHSHLAPPPPAQLNLPQANDELPEPRGKDGTPSKGPRFGMKWGSRSKDPIISHSHSDNKMKGKLEHNFQPLSLLRFTRCDHCGDKMWGSQLRCASCNISVHTRCVSHVQSHCSQQSNASQEDSQPLPPSMFGRDLVEQVHSDSKAGPRQVPVIVEKCIQAVETLGMEYEGIYRKTGGSGQSRVITQLFERGDYEAFDLRDEDRFNDICSVTSVLKTYLRSLPVPLLTHDLHDHFMSAVEIRDVTTKNSTLAELINQLPTEHYETLRMLMLHLHRVRERSEVNLMNARNLGVVFGPTLMRSRTPGAEFSDMAGKALSVEWMVENAPSVFA
ncbi:Rho-type gtpase-activating protein [Marasmius crinis-equi]|uniref:Rho-type gtpase-activating protein n=1 Tax=Marasmius crinis-equi TaxID=585013 RepID=A0ABR3FK77_9AGAR